MTDPTSGNDTGPTAGPYATAAHAYWRNGWSPLPLPHGRKKPVPDGWTGNTGAWPSGADVTAWTEDRGDGNIALRMPPNVLGIDVDDYGNKPGAAVLTALETQHGPLPPTWTVGSRGGRSGIRFFRIPEGLRWPGILGPGIETIRYGHRYAVVWPSVHPDTGGTYRWTTPDGAAALTEIPAVDDLPALPDAWVTALTGGELATDQPRADLDDATAQAWLDQRAGTSTSSSTGGPGALQLQPCRHMAAAARRATTDLTTAGSRHDAALAGTNRLIWLAGEGHVGGATALAQLHGAFLAAVAGSSPGDRDPAEAEAEWARMVAGAVRMAAAAHPVAGPDPCADPFAGLIPKDSPWTSPTPAAATPSTASPQPSSASPTSSPTPPPASGSTPSPTPAPSPSPTTSSDVSTTATAEDDPADQEYELTLKRHQAAAAEIERIRAQRAAQRALDLEDEDQVVADQVRRRVLQDKAAAAYKVLTEPPAPPFDMGTLAEVLARPADPPMRVADLLPWAGSGLVVAQRKTGKTTLLLNWARSLLTGEPFLGEFDVIPLPDDATVAFLNYEVTGGQLGRWAQDVNVPEDRLVMVNLRGRRNPLGHDDDRHNLAAALREKNVQAVITDPFGRAYTGISQNDNGEVQAFLVGLERFVREDVGALDLLLAAHAGWDGTRTRGASALEDWADTIIQLTRDPEDESRRFMKALGRDVDVDEDELVMDPLTRYLSRSGNGSRKIQRGTQEAAQLAGFVVRAVANGMAPSKAELGRRITAMTDYSGPSLAAGRGDTRLKKAVEHAERLGMVVVDRGENGKGMSVSKATTTTTTAPPPGGGPQTTTTPVGTEGVVVGGPAEAPRTSHNGGGRRTPLAGGKLLYDHASGQTLDAHTGEVVEP